MAHRDEVGVPKIIYSASQTHDVESGNERALDDLYSLAWVRIGKQSSHRFPGNEGSPMSMWAKESGWFLNLTLKKKN